MRLLPLRSAELAWSLAAVALTTVVAPSAQAQDVPECPTTNAVLVAGSTAVKPFLGAVAAELVKGDDPINVIYLSQGSCVGVQWFTATPQAAAAATAVIWSDDGKAHDCALPLSAGTPDVGVSDVYADTCGYSLATGVKEYLGPIQTMTFAVPKKSTEASISAEAAYLTFGLGADGDTPWNDPTYYQVRSASSGTQQMLGTAIRVPAGKWKGTSNSGSGNVRDALNAAQSGTQDNANLSIGILSTDVADLNRSTIKVLPYQHFDQTCGFLPDSTPESLDKQNVRDGHYMVWGPLHLFTKIKSGKPVNAAAERVLDILSGAEDAPFLLPVEAKGGVVPDCAMRVQRSEEVGPLASYLPPHSCECAFVAAATGSAPEGCDPCDIAKDCKDPAKRACNYNFCEVR